VTFETGPLPLDDAVARLAAERFDDDPPLLARLPPERLEREPLPLARLPPLPLARLPPERLAARLPLAFAALALRPRLPLPLVVPPLDREPLALPRPPPAPLAARLLPAFAALALRLPLAFVELFARAGRLLCAIAFPPRCQSGSSRRTDARQRTEMSR
jgi:hypothetical protein